MNEDRMFSEYIQKLMAFCERYQYMRQLDECGRRMKDAYVDSYLREGKQVLSQQQNVTACKCVCDSECPADLMQGIDSLFKAKGAMLVKGNPVVDMHLIKAILWLSDNLDEHLMALETLIRAEDWERLE